MLCTYIHILTAKRLDTFIFSCSEQMETDCDEWGRSSIVAETTVAGLTAALTLMLSLHHAEKKKNGALFARSLVRIRGVHFR